MLTGLTDELSCDVFTNRRSFKNATNAYNLIKKLNKHLTRGDLLLDQCGNVLHGEFKIDEYERVGIENGNSFFILIGDETDDNQKIFVGKETFEYLKSIKIYKQI